MFSKLIKKLTERSDEKGQAVSPPEKAVHSSGPRKFSSVRDFFKERKGLSFFILLILVLVVSTQVRSVVFVVLFIAIAALSKLVQLALPPSLPIGLDLVSVLLVVLTVAYGPFVGITAALVAYYIGTSLLMMTGRRSDPVVFIIPPIGYIITGMAIALLTYGLPGIGYTAMIIYAASVTVMFALYYGAGGLTSFLSFLGTYIPFHLWIYSAYGQTILKAFM